LIAQPECPSAINHDNEIVNACIEPQADLSDPTSLPAALVGVHTVIDCSTARPEEPTNKVDWEGKVRKLAALEDTTYPDAAKGTVQRDAATCVTLVSAS
jgi:hypothetical protein